MAFYAAVVMLLALPGLGHSSDGVRTYPLSGAQDLLDVKVKSESAEYKGRKAVRVTKESFGDGFALLKNSDFQDGTIEVDLAVKITNVPPGARMPGFTGIAFRARADASHYELFYFRPGNSQSENQVMRNHSVQYTATPDFGWYELRRGWPWAYEAYADLQLETWTKVKIEVAGRTARLYLNGSTKPSLIVDGMKGEDLHGAIGLWTSPGEESYFSNLKITPATPQPIRNGGEAAGAWEVKSGTDAAGAVDGSLKLMRDGKKITGTWSGTFGTEQPVSGTWRDGYVELSFMGTWPKELGGAPGNVTLTFAGWIDENAASGRMKVEGRADGQWTAKRR